MSKLAPIQVTSHGHPVSSGIDTIDYYISWKAAEIDTADEHYTEKLVLLPSDTMHQYHNPVFVNGKSTVTNEMVPLEKRDKLFPNINGKSRWYVCMQKPFKLHACFGNMLQKILDEDPECIIILHAGAERWNLDNKRVVFLNPLPHHELLALYREADVVLDSYYAGGCTTSREAFEMNSVVVTLPAKYLGGRWTLAFYNILGVTDAVALDKDDYVRLVVTIGRDDTLRNSIKSKIAKNIHKMWRCEKAVDNWSNALLNIAKGNK
jgi:predicted O-linked N-acetylglucosamine transferase (SPINDLY family)